MTPAAPTLPQWSDACWELLNREEICLCVCQTLTRLLTDLSSSGLWCQIILSSGFPSLEDTTAPRRPPEAPQRPPTTTTTTISSWLRTSLCSRSHEKVGWSSFRLLLICSRGSTCRLLSGSDNPHLPTSRI